MNNFGMSVAVSGVVYAAIFYSIFHEVGFAIFMGGIMGLVSTGFFQILGLNNNDKEVVAYSKSPEHSIINIPKKPLMLINQDVSFEELSGSIVLPCLQGKYGTLFHGDEFKESELGQKVAIHPDFIQILVCSIVESVFFIHLKTSCNMSQLESEQFSLGIKTGYAGIIVDNTKVFTEEEVNKNYQIYLFCLGKLFEHMKMIEEYEEGQLVMSTVIAKAIVDLTYQAYDIHNKNDINAMMIRDLAEMQVNAVVSSAFNAANEFIKRK